MGSMKNHRPLRPIDYFSVDPKYGQLLICGECGSAVVGDLKKGKYVYYSCRLTSKKCAARRPHMPNFGRDIDHDYKRPSISEKELDQLFAEALEDLWWNEETYQKVRASLGSDQKERKPRKSGQIN